jgi:hypothetical protein
MMADYYHDVTLLAAALWAAYCALMAALRYRRRPK